ncbi:hypothetical protein BSKO_00555 [Bryopsis sp. KO-2023]|nr:hypothetical protein BSKO_00555 [Bryopsis sp. KO-2023]
MGKQQRRVVPIALATFILGIVVGALIGRSSVGCGSAGEVVSPAVPAVEYYYGRYYGEIAVEMWNRSLERKSKLICPIPPSEVDPRFLFCLKVIIVFIFRKLISVFFMLLAYLGSKLVLLGKGVKKFFARRRRVDPQKKMSIKFTYKARGDGAAPSSSC